jgi:aspartate-semialdehyde dehydrogenase
MTSAYELFEGGEASRWNSGKVLSPIALLVGFGLGLLIFGGGQQEVPVSDAATDMAALHMSSAASANRLRTIPSAYSPARSWQRLSQQPVGARQAQQDVTAAYYLKPLNGEVLPARCRNSVVTGATGSCEGGDPVVTILGATGLVGQELLRLIPKAWPNAKLQLFASRDKTMEVDGKTYQVKAAEGLEKADAPKGDLAMVALDDDFSRRYVPRLLELGYYVVDKSNCYRMDPNVPLVAGGVNTDLVTDDVKLIANPNCNTIPFCLAVAPLQRKYGLKGATVSSYQAISGAGIGPLDTFLEKCAAGYSQSNRIGTQFSAAEYAGNVVPHNGKTDESGFSGEERKLVFESRKILRLPDFDVSAQCCRVPVAVGHYENAWVTFGQKVTPEDAQAVLTDPKQAPFVVFKPGPVGEEVSSLESVKFRDGSIAGRMRPDPRDATGATLCMTVAGDNLRLGAATNAMRIASRWFSSKEPSLQAPVFPPP